jgi:hypothetical protein
VALSSPRGSLCFEGSCQTQTPSPALLLNIACVVGGNIAVVYAHVPSLHVLYKTGVALWQDCEERFEQGTLVAGVDMCCDREGH